MGGNIPGETFLGGNLPGGGSFPRGSLMGGNFFGRNSPGGDFLRHVSISPIFSKDYQQI